MVIKGEMSLDSLVFEEFSGGGGGRASVLSAGLRERRREGEFV